MPQMNFPPILAGISNQTLVAGQTLNVTNSATDPNVPPQVLSMEHSADHRGTHDQH